MQKQASERFFKKGVLRNFAEFTRKYLWRNLFFDKVKLCRSATSLKTSLWCRCFLVKFVETSFLQITTGRLLLVIAVSVLVIIGGIKVKILEVVHWSQVLNQLLHLESDASTRISRSQSLEASSSFLKLLQAFSKFLKKQPQPESVVTEIRWQKTNQKK